MIIVSLSGFTPLIAELLPKSFGPYMALMLIGFAVGILGHLFRLRLMIVTGIIMIFLATVAFPLAINLSRETPAEVKDLATRSR